jgi:hypothetical protein
MKLIKIFSLVVTVLCSANAGVYAQNATGKLALTKGQKLQVDNIIKSVISQEMMGQQMEIVIDANVVHQLEVKDKKANSYVLSSMLTRLVTSGTAMGQEMKFDSDKPEDLESETGKAIKSQLNVNKEVELSDNAQVIKGVEKDTSSSGGQLMDIVKNVTGDLDESNGASAAFDVIPAGKRAGDSWSDSSITEEIKTYRNYTIKEVNGNTAIVSLTGKQVTKKKVEQQGMEINVTMEGILSGEGTVDMSTGLLKQRTMVLDGTGSAEIMGQTMPVTTKVTTTTTVKAI